MVYLEGILALFAIVDPVGNIPMLIGVRDFVPAGQVHRAYNVAVIVGVSILLIFSFAGNVVLNYVFQIELADVQVAGGILLLITAIDHLVFGQLRKSVEIRGQSAAIEVGCVPLACPLLAGPGAMVTSLST